MMVARNRVIRPVSGVDGSRAARQRGDMVQVRQSAVQCISGTALAAVWWWLRSTAGLVFIPFTVPLLPQPALPPGQSSVANVAGSDSTPAPTMAVVLW